MLFSLLVGSAGSLVSQQVTPIVKAPSEERAEQPLDIYQKVRIGIMIQGQGKPIYSWFGHAGIVLSGPAKFLREVAEENKENFILAGEYNGEDLLFDYGNFDSSGKNFIFRFLAGELDYYKFYKSFQHRKDINAIYEKRGLDVYWLNLDSEAKRKFAKILFRETSPANQLYKYDFYFDNCLTRIRDQLNELFDGGLKTQVTGQSKFTIRQILRREIGNRFWGLLLIEYLQGSRIDEKYSRWDSVFFPSYMPDLLAQLQIPGTKERLLAERENIFPFRREELEQLHTNKYFYQDILGLAIYAMVLTIVRLLWWRRSRVLSPAKVKDIKNTKITDKLAQRTYFGFMVLASLVIAVFSGVLWLVNIMKSYDVGLHNVFVLLGSPFLILQFVALLLMAVRSLRSRATKIFLWNWRIHAYLAILLPLISWLYSWTTPYPMQDILLPWLAVFPILATAAFLPDSLRIHVRSKSRGR